MMIIKAYFGIHKGDIIFASPKTNPATYNLLIEAFEDLNTLNKKMDLSFSFKLYTNEDFDTRIISPIIQLSGEVADTSELFMRSIQMYQLFNRKPKTRRVFSPKSKEAQGAEEIKIGQLVRTTFRNLFAEKKLSKQLINNLLSLEYSKSNFGISYPALKEINDCDPLLKQRQDDKGRPRYWSEEFGNGKYLICNDWYSKNKKHFLDWLSKLV